MLFLLPNWCGGLSTLSLDPLDFCTDVLQALLLAAVPDVPVAAAAAAAAFSFINFPTNLVEVGTPVATSTMDNFLRGVPGGGSGVLAVASAEGEASTTLTTPPSPSSVASEMALPTS